MTQTTATPTPSESTQTFHRWRWLWVWLLFAIVTGLIALSVAYTLNIVVIPAMLLYAALSGPIAFITYVVDRADVDKAVPFFDLIIIALFAGAAAILLAGPLNTWMSGNGKGNFFSILTVGPIEETVKLVVPVIAYFIGAKYRSTRAGLVLGLTSAAGFAVLETMGYGFMEIIKAGALLNPPNGALQAADKSELLKHLMAGAQTPLTRSLYTPFAHLVWTGLVTTVWWNEWEKRGKVTITKAVIGSYVLAMALHSINDFIPVKILPLTFTMVANPDNRVVGIAVALIGIIAFLAVMLISFWAFWRNVKRRVPMKTYGKLFARKSHG